MLSDLLKLGFIKIIQTPHNAPGYSHISLPREYSKGGGVSILLHSRLSYKRSDDLCMSNNIIECLFVEAFIVKKVLIGIIYRPPDTPISTFNDHLKNVIDSIKCSNIPCYLLGDFNINLLNQSSHQTTSDFLDILYSGGFITYKSPNKNYWEKCYFDRSYIYQQLPCKYFHVSRCIRRWYHWPLPSF